MVALRLNEYITETGLHITNKDILQFKNMKVEVIILPLEEKIPEKNFMSFANSITEEDANQMLASLEDCRQIDRESWL